MADLNLATVPDDVADTLRASTVDGNALALPGQLSRDLYVRVDRVLRDLGGKWDRRRRVHVFSGVDDVLTRLQAALDVGVPQLGYFPTPGPLARTVVDAAYLTAAHTVLEPSAGQGGLADLACEVVPQSQITCVELDPTNARVLRAKGYAVHEVDFLEYDGEPADRIVMNPPFGRRRPEVTHTLRAYELLAEGGVLVAILPAGVVFRDDRVTKSLRDVIDEIDENPEGSFKPSGTAVRTVTAIIRR